MPISFDIFTFAPFVVLWVVLCTSIHNVCANQHTNTLKSPSSGSKILIHFIVWVRLTCFTGILCSHKAKRNNCENKYPQKGRRKSPFLRANFVVRSSWRCKMLEALHTSRSELTSTTKLCATCPLAIPDVRKYGPVTRYWHNPGKRSPLSCRRPR